MIAVLAVSGLALGLTACSASPSPGDLVGVWRNADGVALLTLRTGGSCTAHLLPYNADIVSGTCTWRITHGENASVELDFTADPKAALRAASYRIDGDGSGATLYEVTDADTNARDVLSR